MTSHPVAGHVFGAGGTFLGSWAPHAMSAFVITSMFAAALAFRNGISRYLFTARPGRRAPAWTVHSAPEDPGAVRRVGDPDGVDPGAADTVTLYPGVVLLSGTPANSRPVEPGDVVEVEVDGLGQPTESEEVLSTAWGGDWEFRGVQSPRRGS